MIKWWISILLLCYSLVSFAGICDRIFIELPAKYLTKSPTQYLDKVLAKGKSKDSFRVGKQTFTRDELIQLKSKLNEIENLGGNAKDTFSIVRGLSSKSHISKTEINQVLDDVVFLTPLLNPKGTSLTNEKSLSLSYKLAWLANKKNPEKSFSQTFRKVRDAIESIPVSSRSNSSIRAALSDVLKDMPVKARNKLLAEAFSDPKTWMQNFAGKVKTVLNQLTFVRRADDLPKAPKLTKAGILWKTLDQYIQPQGGDLINPILSPITGYQLRFAPSLALGIAGIYGITQVPVVGPVLSWLYEIHPIALMASALQHFAAVPLKNSINDENQLSLERAKEAACMAKNYELFWKERFPQFEEGESQELFLKKLAIKERELVDDPKPYASECTWLNSDVKNLSEDQKKSISLEVYNSRQVLANIAKEIINYPVDERKKNLFEIVKKYNKSFSKKINLGILADDIRLGIDNLKIRPWGILEFSKLYFSLQLGLAKQLCPNINSDEINTKLTNYFAEVPQCEESERSDESCRFRFDLRIPQESKSRLASLSLEVKEQMLTPIEVLYKNLNSSKATSVFAMSWERSFWDAGYCEQFFPGYAQDDLNNIDTFDISKEFFLDSSAAYKIDELYYLALKKKPNATERAEILNKLINQNNLKKIFNDSQLSEVLDYFVKDENIPIKEGALGYMIQIWLMEQSCTRTNTNSTQPDKREHFNPKTSPKTIYNEIFRKEILLNSEIPSCSQ